MACWHRYRANRPCLLQSFSWRSTLKAPRLSNASNTETAETILQAGRATKSDQDKLALGFTVPPFIMHLHTIIFILEP